MNGAGLRANGESTLDEVGEDDGGSIVGEALGEFNERDNYWKIEYFTYSWKEGLTVGIYGNRVGHSPECGDFLCGREDESVVDAIIQTTYGMLVSRRTSLLKLGLVALGLCETGDDGSIAIESGHVRSLGFLRVLGGAWLWTVDVKVEFKRRTWTGSRRRRKWEAADRPNTYRVPAVGRSMWDLRRSTRWRN
jgi:hypothetical protein